MDMSRETREPVEVSPEAAQTVTALVRQAINGSTEEIMARLERLEEAMCSHAGDGNVSFGWD